MAATFGRSDDAGGDARAPSLDSRSPIGVGDRLHGDDGWWAGVTVLVCQAAPGAIFRGITMALRRPHKRMKMAATFGRSDDAGGDARAPSLGPRLRGDDDGGPGWRF